MKRTAAVIGVLAVLGFATAAWAMTIIPTFTPSQTITWGSGQVIQVGQNGPIPNVGDWDRDGVKDLMVGVYQSGNIYYYRNTGTNANPVFPTRTLLTADGLTIALTYG
jgi:hypothetical protein